MRQVVMRLGAAGWLACVVCGAAVAAAAAQDAPEAPAPPPAATADPSERLITMDFQDVDISVLVKFISEITGRNFIIDEKVRGKVTIISPGKISADEAYLVFQSVLQVKGFTTVPSGAVIKIVSTKEAKSSTLETVLAGRTPAATDEYITRLLPMKYVDANNMVAVLQPLVSADGLLAAYPATNTLIIIDTAAQTDRLSKILHQLDVEGFEQSIEVVRLNYAFASDMAGLLQQVLEEQATGAAAGSATQPAAAPDARVRRGARPAGAAPGAGSISGGSTPERSFKIIPDERTNALIVMAGPPEMRRIKDLIVRLDVPLPLGTGRINVYYLKYANAFELVPVLGALLGGGGGGALGGIGGGFGGFGGGQFGGIGGLRGGGLGSRGGLRGAAGGAYGGAGGFGGGYGGGGLGGYGGGLGGYGGGLGGVGGGSRYGGFGQSGFGASGSIGGRGGGRGYGGTGTASGGLGGGSTSAQGGGQFEGDVRITADPAINALLINASPQDFDTLREVIEKLDVRRRQVYVEAIIAEVSIQRSRELGIEFQGVADLNNGVGVARTNLSGDINSILSPANLQGLILAAASSQTITINGVTLPAQQIILRALERDTDANILSAPTVLTTDNGEAEVVAGQNVPFITSNSTDSANLANNFQTIERRDVGITLRITPQISEGGTVRLDIFQEVSDVISNDPRLGPTTTIRSATTSVVVKDAHTVVIGGLIFDAVTKDQSRVPFLSDIPVIGNFFRSSALRNRKTNLLIFLTPHIVRNDRDHQQLSLNERERVMLDEHLPGRRTELYHSLTKPSWEIRPSTEAVPTPVQGSGADAPSSGSRLAPVEPPAPAPDRLPVPRREEPAAPLREEPVSAAPAAARRATTDLPAANRYVLLASVAESGQAPASLTTSNGLLALAVPSGPALETVFRKGYNYRFQGDGYAATYVCLEVFGSPQDAFAAYPDGVRVSSTPSTFLHWQEPTEPATLNVSNWNRTS